MTKVYVSNLEDHLGYWLRCLSNCIDNSFANKLMEYNVSTAQWVVLRSLYDHQNITLKQAVEAVGVDKSSLSRMVERLVKRGLVNRSEGKNRSSISLSLTEEGMELVPHLARVAVENEDVFFRSLNLKEREALIDTFKKLLADNDWKKSKRFNSWS